MNRRVRRSRGIAALALALALAGACRAPVPAPVYDRSAGQPGAAVGAADERPSHHLVRQGDTLYGIAWRYGLDYRALANWNGIGPPYLIHPGSHLRLFPPEPGPDVAAGTRETGAGVTTRGVAAPPRAHAPVPVPSESAPADSTPAPAPRPVQATPVPAAKPAAASPAPGPAAIHWQWPTTGEIISEFAPGRSRGIDIAGEPGQPILAAAAGEVVYSGVGLVGYGELIIIKHDDEFLSAYAHNRRRLVGEGDRVSAGKTIAELGDSGADRPKLHFEIRKNGQPVDPRRYLPRGGGN